MFATLSVPGCSWCWSPCISLNPQNNPRSRSQLRIRSAGRERLRRFPKITFRVSSCPLGSSTPARRHFCLVGSCGCSGDSMSFGGTISCYGFCPHNGDAVWGEPHIPKSNEWTLPHPQAPRTGLSQRAAKILTEEPCPGQRGRGRGEA